MKRSREEREIDDRLARMHAEDDAVVYLSKFPCQVALATAFKVESFLAAAWSMEQSEMIKRRDPRKVLRITPDDFMWLRKVCAMVPPGVPHDDEAMRHIIHLLADFPRDKAWWIAHAVTKWEACKFRCKQLPPINEPVQIPDAVKRAAALANSRCDGSRGVISASPQELLS